MHVLTRAGRDYLVAAVESARPPGEIAADFGGLVPGLAATAILARAADKLPRTPRGKLDVAALQARLEARPAKSTESASVIFPTATMASLRHV